MAMLWHIWRIYFECSKWCEIAESFMEIYEGVAIDGRRCRERTSLLLSYFKADDREKLYRYEWVKNGWHLLYIIHIYINFQQFWPYACRSGCDEEYDKKSQLLQEVLEMSLCQKKEKNENQKDGNDKGKLIRKKAMENMTCRWNLKVIW